MVKQRFPELGQTPLSGFGGLGLALSLAQPACVWEHGGFVRRLGLPSLCLGGPGVSLLWAEPPSAVNMS